MPCISTTLPAAAARIGVPAGTPMSMPGWQDSHERDSQNGDVIGPLTGQIRPPRAGLDRAGGGRRRRSPRAGPGLAPARPAGSRRRPGARGGDRASWPAASYLVVRGSLDRSRRSTRPTRTRTPRRAGTRSPSRPSPPRASRACPAAPRSPSRRLGVGDDLHDLRVLAGDPGHELGAREQVLEAVGVEHHADEVGLVGLVEVQQALGQRAADHDQAGLQAGQAGALLPQLALHRGELLALGVQGRLQLLLAEREAVDVRLQVLMRPVCLEMSVVSTRSLALWPPMSPFLRSSSFWICPGVFCGRPAGRPSRTGGTTSNKHTSSGPDRTQLHRRRG